MSFDQVQGEFGLIEKVKHENEHESEQVYDKELEALMSELNHPNLQSQFNENPLEHNPLEDDDEEDDD